MHYGKCGSVIGHHIIFGYALGRNQAFLDYYTVALGSILNSFVYCLFLTSSLSRVEQECRAHQVSYFDFFFYSFFLSQKTVSRLKKY